VSSENSTAERILTAFARLVAERGLDATTTRVLAEAAGVNEVTIFRCFGDKANLARAFVRHFDPVATIEALPIDLDPNAPGGAADGLFRLLRAMRDQMRAHPEWLQFGLGEYWRFPELRQELAAVPLAARNRLEGALALAEPALRPDLDRSAVAFSLMGLLIVTVVWQSRGWLTLDDASWDAMLRGAIRPLLREEETT